MGKRFIRLSDEAELKVMIIFNLIGEDVMRGSIEAFKYMKIYHEEVHFNLQWMPSMTGSNMT